MEDAARDPSAGKAPLAPARRSAVPAFIVMDVMEAAAAKEARGGKVIHMEVGQPGTPAPATALAAVKRALDRETLGYTVALGLPALRERICRHYRQRYGVSVAPERVVVTTGSSAGFVLAFLALFDTGAKVALPSPGYPCYRHTLTALGQTPVLLPTDASARWMPTAQHVEEARRREGIAGLVIASPANPTGTMLEPGRLAEIAQACRANNVWFVSDEIYHGLTYGMQEETALAHNADAVVVNSFSKYFSMTGWRIGWMVVPEAMLRSVECLAQNLFISPPTLAQIAAAAAMDCRSELDANVARYGRNRGALLAGLPAVGVDTWAPADGAFYVYADVSRLTNDSEELCRRVLAETGVALTPGIDFDAARGRRYVRISYAGAETDIAAALARLSTWAASGRSRS
jgi:aspartate/methionine/tyrosine aminotransferase